MSPTPATVFIIDDDELVLGALEALVTSVGLRAETYISPRQFLSGYQPTHEGCVILDMRLPGMSGLELQAALKAQAIDLPVIVISGYGDVSSAVRAMKAGAVDFFQKPIDGQLLLEAIQRAVAAGAARSSARAEAEAVRSLLASLSPRERDVLDGVLSGEPNKRIAGRLGIAEKTVEAHRARLMSKLEARNIVDLVKKVLLASPEGLP
ncbi:MAG: response regulator [Rhodospirillales bacterium]|jgi:FixJ family two-component response regulator|nr:response regulator [Rhodospirillales bacterium]